MRAIVCDGGALRWGEVDDPAFGAGDLVMRVRATSVNRADLLQRAGRYPPPPGASPVLGLEAAGVVEAVGRDVVGWRPGDEVMALLAGGGYAERVAVDARHA
ncbi:MAG: alcohol dehydrogenase catalytic domain-containing protein, partial [Planctomycetota bacterium]|nr:alcohol dehydrogenase catalytic domain-containing protein [Planctomycetota bacterium]